MGDIIPFDMRLACMVDLKGVDSITEKENHLASGVGIQYKCEHHGSVTIVLDKVGDGADLVAWGAAYGSLLWGPKFAVAFADARSEAEEYRDKIMKGNTGDL